MLPDLNVNIIFCVTFLYIYVNIYKFNALKTYLKYVFLVIFEGLSKIIQKSSKSVKKALKSASEMY